MAATRRLGSKDSAVRAAIIAAAGHVLRETGFSGITSRKVADKAGVKPQLVHYYFQTMDDLMVALAQRMGNEGISRIAGALSGEDPMAALWGIMSDTRGAAIEVELIALATHNARMREEVVRYGEQARIIQTHAIERHFERKGVEPPLPPVAIAFLMGAVRRMMSTEKTLGAAMGHREMEAVIAEWRKALTHPKSPTRSRGAAKKKPPAAR